MNRRQIGPELARQTNCKISWDKEILDFYSVDASSYTVKPSAVAFPEKEKDIIKILRFASRHKIPVTPRGAGTGLTGSDLGRGIILDMRNFNKIRVGRGFVEAGSGTPKGEVDKALKKHGMFLGPNPSIGPFCTIGGMVGTNAAGSHSKKNGSVIDNLLGVRIVMSDGKVVNLPEHGGALKKFLLSANSEVSGYFPKVSKNSCGYRIDKIKSRSDVQKIFAGSEGTLGIIISAKLKTVPLPKQTALIVLSYDNLKHAAAEVPQILRIRPSAAEIVDHNIVSHIKAPNPRKTRCLLFVEFDDEVSKKVRECKRILSGKIVASTKASREIDAWWRYRNSALSYSLRSVTGGEMIFSFIEDATVPVHRLPLLLDLVQHLLERYPMRVIIYGHAGNGNLHIRPVIRKKHRRQVSKIAREFFLGVISIGGTISGEHGDGLARTKFVRLQYGAKTHSTVGKLKRLFDPVNTLNPGKNVA